MAYIGLKKVKNGSEMGHFWVILDHFLGRSGVTLGSLVDRFGILLGSFLVSF